MSPTSYQTAPPRISIIINALATVKPQKDLRGVMQLLIVILNKRFLRSEGSK
jgi:hypothetical protein